MSGNSTRGVKIFLDRRLFQETAHEQVTEFLLTDQKESGSLTFHFVFFVVV